MVKTKGRKEGEYNAVKEKGGNSAVKQKKPGNCERLSRPRSDANVQARSNLELIELEEPHGTESRHTHTQIREALSNGSYSNSI